MKKTILLATAFLLLAPAFADTYTIDTDLLGNSTTYIGHPSDIYVLLYDFNGTQKIVTITIQDQALNVNELLPSGVSYTNSDLNLTVTCSLCANQTCVCEAPICDYSGNLTSEAQCLAYQQLARELNTSIQAKDYMLEKCLNNSAIKDNMTVVMAQDLSDMRMEASGARESGKREQAMLDWNGFIGGFGIIGFIMVVIIVVIGLAMKFTGYEYSGFKNTFEVDLTNPEKPVTRKHNYNSQVAPSGDVHWEVAGRSVHKSNIMAHHKDDNQQTVVICPPEIQDQKGFSKAKLEQEKEKLQTKLEKVEKEHSDYKKSVERMITGQELEQSKK